MALSYLEELAAKMKRLMDILASAFGLIILSPVFFTVGLIIRITMGPPIFFKQKRPGKAGQPFHLYKFRTMTELKDETGNFLPDNDRLTAFGKFLRSTSMDELPELYNVLKGDMSLVGPRPLLMEYLPLYSGEQNRRHEVIPGITGWAQVNGRNSIDWEEKFVLDLWYVDNRTALLDAKILLLTAVNIFFRKGISHEGNSTMEEFKGTGN